MKAARISICEQDQMRSALHSAGSFIFAMQDGA